MNSRCRVRMPQLTFKAAAFVLLITAIVGFAAAPAFATPHERIVKDAAGRSPWAGRHCNVTVSAWMAPGGKEGESDIAVSPVNARNQIAVWMDRTRGTVNTAYTKNGGRIWTQSVPEGIDGCTGNHTFAWEASGDPSVSFGPDGVAYFSSLSWGHFNTPPFTKYRSVLHVQTSVDGGAHWSKPVYITKGAVSDKDMILADASVAGTVYAVYRNQNFGLPVGARGATRFLFSKSLDWGRTWSPVIIARGTRAQFFGNPQLARLSNGTLVVTTSLTNKAGVDHLLAYRSTDGGASWSGAITIRALSNGPSAQPGACGQSIGGQGSGDAISHDAVVNGHSIVLVNIDGAAQALGRGKIILSRSDDGGLTWHSWPVVASRFPIALAQVAAQADGTLGLVWDRINIPAANCKRQRIPARTLFAESSDGGSTWGDPIAIGASRWNEGTTLVGPSGYYLGEYQGMVGTPTGFLAATPQGRALAGDSREPHIFGQTGILVADIRGR